jgi:hypothetical protein
VSDIVERLRVNMYAYGVCQEAADEIVRLRAEVARIKLEAKEVDGLWHLDILRANAAEAECARMRDALDQWQNNWAQKIAADLAEFPSDTAALKGDTQETPQDRYFQSEQQRRITMPLRKLRTDK